MQEANFIKWHVVFVNELFTVLVMFGNCLEEPIFEVRFVVTIVDVKCWPAFLVIAFVRVEEYGSTDLITIQKDVRRHQC